MESIPDEQQHLVYRTEVELQPEQKLPVAGGSEQPRSAAVSRQLSNVDEQQHAMPARAPSKGPARAPSMGPGAASRIARPISRRVESTIAQPQPLEEETKAARARPTHKVLLFYVPLECGRFLSPFFQTVQDYNFRLTDERMEIQVSLTNIDFADMFDRFAPFGSLLFLLLLCFLSQNFQIHREID